MLFVETSEFSRHLQSHLDDDGYAALQALLSIRPDVGDIIPGSGGIRKVRWRSRGRGKQGGIRVLYYWLHAEGHVYLLTLYRKGVKDNVTQRELAAWRKVVEDIEND